MLGVIVLLGLALLAEANNDIKDIIGMFTSALTLL